MASHAFQHLAGHLQCAFKAAALGARQHGPLNSTKARQASHRRDKAPPLPVSKPAGKDDVASIKPPHKGGAPGEWVIDMAARLRNCRAPTRAAARHHAPASQ